jgi:hypothetical protein
MNPLQTAVAAAATFAAVIAAGYVTGVVGSLYDEKPAETISAPADVVAAPAPAPVSAPPPEPTEDAYGSYGDDATLDRLVDRCESGHLESCVELYWESDIDSGYERYAKRETTESELMGDTPVGDMTQGNTYYSPTDALEFIWAGYGASERNDWCEAYNNFGPELSHSFVVDGMNGSAQEPTLREFINVFDPKC